MPTPLETRALNGLVAQAVAVSGANVPAERHYRRDVLSYSPDRDGGLPGCVVARTPGRGVVGPTPRLLWNEWQFPCTALLIDTAGGQVVGASGDDWRADWPRVLAEVLLGTSPLRVIDPQPEDESRNVSEVHYVNPDPLVILDLSAFEEAGLWQSAVPLIVTVRTPL